MMKQMTIKMAFHRIQIITLVFLLFMPAVDAQKVTEQDSLALVAIYHATDGPNWISHQDGFSIDDLKDGEADYYTNNPDAGMNRWLEGPVKDWYGVIVEKQATESGIDSVFRVVEVWPVLGRRENGQNKLAGYLPREIGFLTALRKIKLDGNSGFEGSELPEELYQNDLEQLHMEGGKFEGGISDAIRSCSNFKKFNLRYNNFYYIPTFDFMTEENLRNSGTQWLYSTRISFEYIEPTIDYFYTLSPNIQEFSIEVRDNTNVGQEREVVAGLGESVTITIKDAGSQGKVNWYKNGLNTWLTGEDYIIDAVEESDYGDYMGRLENDYIKSYDKNGNYGAHDTKLIHLVAEPATPVCSKAETSYDGKSLLLYFTKPMETPEISDAGSFVVDNGTATILVEGIERTGYNRDRLILNLEEPLEMGQAVKVSYTPGNVVCANGGVLEAFSDTTVNNLTREIPHVKSAITTSDGWGVLVTFDRFMDPASLFAGDFSVNDGTDNPVVGISISRGEVNETISKTVLLLLTNSLTEEQSITVGYSRGNLRALYGGMSENFDPISVENVVQVDRTEVTLTFTDGSEVLENIFVSGIAFEPKPLFDDGSNGDEIAGDHVWAAIFELTDGEYLWDVLTRSTEIRYDTTTVVDEETGEIQITLTPIEVQTDSILSGDINLSFSIANSSVTGDTSFGIIDKSVTLHVDMSHYEDYYPGDVGEVYLMGINDDWTEGLLMTPGENDIHSITIDPFSAGDELEFNFRNGDVWENHTLAVREYVVAEADNILNLVFGDYLTSTLQLESLEIEVFPNPASHMVTILCNRSISTIQLINSLGQVVDMVDMESGNNRVHMDLSSNQGGLHLLKIETIDKAVFIKKLLITNK